MKRLLMTALGACLPLAACANQPAEGPPLKDTYWKLVELRGQPVVKGPRDSYMVLKDGGQVQGNGGCNGMGGTYTLKAPDRLSFGPMVSTQMACVDGMETETGFHAVLQQVDSYVIGDDGRLQLLKARMAPLAVLEAVALP